MVNSRSPTTHSNRPRVTVLINDNYCVPQWGLMTMGKKTETFVGNFQTLNVNCFVADHVPFVVGQLQKKGLSPIIVKQRKKLKCGRCFCVDQLSSVQHVTSVHTVAQNLPVGARLNQFWEILASLAASSKVTRILKEGYTLPLRN